MSEARSTSDSIDAPHARLRLAQFLRSGRACSGQCYPCSLNAIVSIEESPGDESKGLTGFTRVVYRTGENPPQTGQDAVQCKMRRPVSDNTWSEPVPPNPGLASQPQPQSPASPADSDAPKTLLSHVQVREWCEHETRLACDQGLVSSNLISAKQCPCDDVSVVSSNAKLTDDDERADKARLGT